ncbi:uncharacterized protein [Antedon mediterranea]|uniref:uncharacterized protein n=1 Tax=Antedon mediterranea TaxID=105859 RepID=UPI003AF9866D
MNRSTVILIVIVLTFGVSSISSVVVVNELIEFDDSKTNRLINVDAEAIINKIEHDTFEEVSKTKSKRYNLKKCCRVGKNVADELMFCNIDLMLVAGEKIDKAHRRKKFNKLLTEQHDLIEKVESCYPSKSSRMMLKKCCLWHQSLTDEMDSCKRMENKEDKRQCRRFVKEHKRQLA